MINEQDKQRSGLYPCPFCGSEPEWINEALADSHFYIRCPYCRIVMKEDRRDKVIGMWNSRSEKLLQEYREVLTETLHYIHDYYLTGIQDRDYRKSLQSLEYRVKSLIEPKTDKA